MYLSCSVMSDSFRSMDYSPPGSSVPGDSPGKNTGVGYPCPPPGDLPDPGVKPGSTALQADSLPLSYHKQITTPVWDKLKDTERFVKRRHHKKDTVCKTQPSKKLTP